MTRYPFGLSIVVVLHVGLPAPQPAELFVRGGLIVTEARQFAGDLRIRGEQIAEIGESLRPGAGARVIDARGLLVLPGGVDPHVHLGGNLADDYTSGSAAALAGGITTVANFVSPARGEGLLAALQREAGLVRAQAVADVILHPIVASPDGVAAELPAMMEAGHTTVKVFMVRPQFEQALPAFMANLEAARDAGILTMVHCEDATLVSQTSRRLADEGRGSLRFFPQSRPVVAEVVATQRAVAMSEATGAPIYVVHLSSERALRVVEEARARGLKVFVETRPIYLHFTDDRFEGEERGLYVGQPPLRTARDRDALWAALATGAIDVVGTDHVAYRREQKLDPEQSVVRHRAGMSQLQEIRPLLYSEGVRSGRITLERFVAVTSTNPAKLFGLYPRKGTIAEGSDADLVLWDPDLTRTVRDEDMLSGSRFSIHAGSVVTGWPTLTIRRGQVVFEGGRVTGTAGSGQLLRREKWQAPQH
jgi:dihydropyrimidinase